MQWNPQPQHVRSSSSWKASALVPQQFHPRYVPLFALVYWNVKTHIPGFRLPILPCRRGGENEIRHASFGKEHTVEMHCWMVGKQRRRRLWRIPSHYDWLSFDSLQINKHIRASSEPTHGWLVVVAVSVCGRNAFRGYYDESNVRMGNDDGILQNHIIVSFRVIGTPEVWSRSEILEYVRVAPSKITRP